MKLFSWMGKKAFGDVVADYGELPSNEHGWRVSVTLRRIREQPPYLLFKWEQGDSNRFWTSLACTPEVYERLENILRDSRDHVDRGPG
jgi:hypothetical protein